jgi:hypothetical protein
MNVVIESEVKKVGFSNLLNPDILMSKLGRLEKRRGEISSVKVYYRRNRGYRPCFNQGGYIRMKVIFRSGEVERYYLGSSYKCKIQWRNS